MFFFDSLISVLSVLGSLTLFLFGMKLMSESLQRLGGSRMHKVFSSIVSNRFRAISAGFLVTGFIQSSSAVTVMLVSFVNAGLFNLTQALGIMMGANIGTTVTAWLVSYFGFRVDFNIILLPMLGMALPFLFMKGTRKKAIGEFITGFALLFLGLQFMKSAIPGIEDGTPLVGIISGFTNTGLASDLLFVGVGLVITLLIQSSSATIALTFVMCHNGLIGYDNAAAMILGENLGTTITANLAAIMANSSAKRLALGHTLFNLIGIIWALIFFRYMIDFSSATARLLAGNNTMFLNGDISTLGLSVFHTGFNLVNTLLLVWFIPQLKKLLEIIIPLRANEKKSYRLKYFKSKLMSMNEVELLQAREEIHLFGKHVAYMFSLIPEYLTEKREGKFEKIQKRIIKCEEQADEYEREIAEFITKITENDLSEANSRRVRSMLKIIDDLESIADQCMQMERTIRNKNEAKAWFTQEMRDALFLLFDLVNESLTNMNDNLSKDYRPGILAKATETELRINEMRDKLISLHKQKVDAGEFPYKQAAYYAELLNQCEKLADHVINVNQAIASNTK